MGIKAVTIFGIPLYLHASLAAIPLLAVLVDPNMWWFCAALGFVLVHEYAHSLAAVAVGHTPTSVTLTALGGVAEIRCDGPSQPRHEAVVILAGPLSNLVMAAVAALGAWGGVGQESLSHLATINLMLFGFNMLPAFPLDGGRLLRVALTSLFDFEDATVITCGIGTAVAVVMAVVGIVIGAFGMVVIAAFALFVQWGELHKEAPEGEDPDEADARLLRDIQRLRDVERRG